MNSFSSADKCSIWVVIRACNEEKLISSTLAGVLDCGYSVVVVDDGSTDATFAQAAAAAGVHICRHTINLGAGAALQTGIEYAVRRNAAVIVSFDADGQHDAADIESVARPILDGMVDVVLGSRFMKAGSVENIPRPRLLLLKGAIWMTRLTTGLKLTDSHNGFKAFAPHAARKLQITQNRMAYGSEILSQIAREKRRTVEVPVHVRYTDYSLQKGQKDINALNILWEFFIGSFKL